MATQKINLDKYYTDKSIAKHCLLKTYSVIGLNNITEIIEPSAGNGSFSLMIPKCIAYDLEPEHESIIKQDFLKLELPYKKGRLFIGNPPFGTRNTMSVKFFKQAVKMGDYIAFVLPVSQYNNGQQMYEFDLIHSEILPEIEYSGRRLLCCFNIYKRPFGGVNTSPTDYTLKDVTVKEWRRGGTSKPVDYHYDYGICSWGSIGKQIETQGQYALENYIVVNNPVFRERVVDAMKTAVWGEMYPCIATPRLGMWKIYKYLKEQIPELE